MDEFVCPPGFQLYVVPPPAVSVTMLPAQIVELPLELIVAMGTDVTAIEEEADAVHPFAAVTVTVYEEFIVGVTEIIFVLAPVFQE